MRDFRQQHNLVLFFFCDLFCITFNKKFIFFIFVNVRILESELNCQSFRAGISLRFLHL